MNLSDCFLICLAVVVFIAALPILFAIIVRTIVVLAASIVVLYRGIASFIRWWRRG